MTDKTEVDNEFFSRFKEGRDGEFGIPGYDLRRPIADGGRYKGSIGLEIEIEGANLATDGDLAVVKTSDKTGWQVTTDGSLRGEAYEYILSKPTSIENVKLLVSALYKTFSVKRSIINNTNRCSTHVHINCNNRKVNEVISAFCLWYVFEPFIIEAMGEARKNNHFCLPLSVSDAPVEALQRFLRTGRIPDDRNLKYASVNVLTLWRLGSLEFRCGPVPDSEVMPTKFAEICYRITQYAFDNYNNPQLIASDVSELGVRELSRRVLGDDLTKELLGDLSDNIVNAMSMDVFRNAQRLIYNFPWHTWLPEIDKPYIKDPFGVRKGAKRVTEDPQWPLNELAQLQNQEVEINRVLFRARP